GGDELGAHEHRVRPRVAHPDDAVLGLDAHDPPGGHRYCPVVPTCSIRRCASGAPLCCTIVRLDTIRSPFLPDTRAQSSGFVVFGRSSFSRNSARQPSSRWSSRMPRVPVASRSLIAPFFARSTMLAIIAPEAK